MSAAFSLALMELKLIGTNYITVKASGGFFEKEIKMPSNISFLASDEKNNIQLMYQ